jgi:hypothetical protein
MNNGIDSTFGNPARQTGVSVDKVTIRRTEAPRLAFASDACEAVVRRLIASRRH